MRDGAGSAGRSGAEKVGMTNLKDGSGPPRSGELADDGAPDEGGAEVRRRVPAVPWQLSRRVPAVPPRTGAVPGPSTRPKSNADVVGLLEAARDEAERASEAIEKGTPHLTRALAHTLDLRHLCDANESAKEDLAAEYADARIKEMKRTWNPFTPMVKLVFRRELPSTDVSRYAYVLWLARKRGVEPESLKAFLKENGGIVACAETAAAERRAETQGTSELPMMEKVLRARRRAAKRIRLPALDFLPEADMMTVLLERAEGGGFRILGARPATLGSARRYLPARRD
jgi:hypothetical protein